MKCACGEESCNYQCEVTQVKAYPRQTKTTAEQAMCDLINSEHPPVNEDFERAFSA